MNEHHRKTILLVFHEDEAFFFAPDTAVLGLENNTTKC